MAEKSEFQAKVLKEEQVLYDGPCGVLFVPDFTGKNEIAILPYHTPIIALVGGGVVKIGARENPKVICEIKSGIIHFSDNRATILVNT